MSKKKSLREVQQDSSISSDCKVSTEWLLDWKTGRLEEKDWKTACHHCTRRQRDEEDSCEVTYEFNEEN